MRIGIKFDLRNPAPWARAHSEVYAKCLEWCEHADAHGIGSLWISEHHFFEDGYMPQPLVFATAVAARTHRARVGTAILLAPLRAPILIAEEAAVVDILSNGRLDLGLGAGHSRREFETYGVDFASRFVVTDAAAEEVRRLWSEGVVTPAPVQDQVPIYLGYAGPKGAYRAGRAGFGLINIEPDVCEAYINGLRDGGLGPGSGRLAGDLMMLLTDDPERTFELVKNQLAWRYDTYNAYSAVGSSRPAPAPVDPEAWRPGATPRPQPGFAPATYHIITPDEAILHVEQLASSDYPIEDLHLYCISGIPDEVTERHIELVCGRLVPAVANMTRVSQRRGMPTTGGSAEATPSDTRGT